MKTTCLLLMKQKLYALGAFFIEKIKLSENDPCTEDKEHCSRSLNISRTLFRFRLAFDRFFGIDDGMSSHDVVDHLV